MTFRSFRNIPHGLHRIAQLEGELANNFASAHPARTASVRENMLNELRDLCLSTSRTDCISKIAQMQCHKSTQYAVSW